MTVVANWLFYMFHFPPLTLSATYNHNFRIHPENMGSGYSILESKYNKLQEKYEALQASNSKKIDELIKQLEDAREANETKIAAAISKAIKEATKTADDGRSDIESQRDELLKQIDELTKQQSDRSSEFETQKQEMEAQIAVLNDKIESPDFAKSLLDAQYEALVKAVELEFAKNEGQREINSITGTLALSVVGCVSSGKSSVQNCIYSDTVCSTSATRSTEHIAHTGTLVFPPRRGFAQLRVRTYDVPGNEAVEVDNDGRFDYLNPDTLRKIASADIFVVVVDNKFGQIARFVRVVVALNKKIIFVRSKIDTTSFDSEGIEVVREKDIAELRKLGIENPIYMCISAHNHMLKYWKKSPYVDASKVPMFDWFDFIQAIEDVGYSLLDQIDTHLFENIIPVKPTRIDGYTDVIESIGSVDSLPTSPGSTENLDFSVINMSDVQDSSRRSAVRPACFDDCDMVPPGQKSVTETSSSSCTASSPKTTPPAYSSL
jgi:hypothetical protein